MSVKKSKETFYISKKIMMKEINYYKDTGIISEELGKMFLDIAKRFTSSTNFYRYSYKEDMIGDAVARMISQIDRFDTSHPSCNPFSYFTQIAYCQILQLLKKEKRMAETKVNLRDKLWEDMCLEERMLYETERATNE
jgi:DNA-directed RNA polymerase specialized sigma24 family protein